MKEKLCAYCGKNPTKGGRWKYCSASCREKARKEKSLKWHEIRRKERNKQREIDLKKLKEQDKKRLDIPEDFAKQYTQKRRLLIERKCND